MAVKFRHEWKHVINMSDRITIRQRLRTTARVDSHAVEGIYQIRSLYFDNLADKALREKIDGVNKREKFRIRYYNGNTGLIHLEKKSKINGLCSKESTAISREEAQKIVDGDLDFMKDAGRPLLAELYSKMHSQGLKPMTIVDYTREPFVYGPGNVRVTIDYDIRTGLGCTDFLDWNCVTVPVQKIRTSKPCPDFLDWNCVTVPAGGAPAILEVKWDEFLPDPIRHAVQLDSRMASAFSKYAACRIYG